MCVAASGLDADQARRLYDETEGHPFLHGGLAPLLHEIDGAGAAEVVQAMARRVATAALDVVDLARPSTTTDGRVLAPGLALLTHAADGPRQAQPTRHRLATTGPRAQRLATTGPTPHRGLNLIVRKLQSRQAESRGLLATRAGEGLT